MAHEFRLRPRTVLAIASRTHAVKMSLDLHCSAFLASQVLRMEPERPPLDPLDELRLDLTHIAG